MSDTPPKSAAELDAVATALYLAMGRAMARWQHVESAMFILTHAIMNTDYKYTSAAFYMLKGADMKQQLLSRLCEAHFDTKIIKDEWNPIKKEIKSGVSFRNGLAHYEISYMPNRAYLGPHDPPVVLSAHHLDHKASSRSTVPAASASELRQAAAEWLTLSRRLIYFVCDHFELEKLRATNLPHQWLLMLSNMRGNSPTPPRPQQSSPV
ncbi:hypothetical protein LOC51_43385 [Rubrivivax sp. JA1024]|nr:hypothetical protein [Rubrivivax sp. JA1024]